MLSELSPLFSRVATWAKPEDLLLQKGGWVRFTDQWPDEHAWASGKVFQVSEEPLLVPYAVSKIWPASDYDDLDLSNASDALKLYPERTGCLYEIVVGLKEGDYVVHTYIPSGRYVYQLGDTSMYPSVGSTTLRYLGAKRPEDSPAGSPLWRFYCIKDMPAIILRPYVLQSVDFEKVTLEFSINKCQLKEIERPTPEQVEKARLLRWYEEFGTI